jgi:hypothetical protein
MKVGADMAIQLTTKHDSVAPGAPNPNPTVVKQHACCPSPLSLIFFLCPPSIASLIVTDTFTHFISSKINGNNHNNRPCSPGHVTPQSRPNYTLTLPRGCNSNHRRHCSPRPIPANCLRPSAATAVHPCATMEYFQDLVLFVAY